MSFSIYNSQDKESISEKLTFKNLYFTNMNFWSKLMLLWTDVEKDPNDSIHPTLDYATETA